MPNEEIKMRYITIHFPRELTEPEEMQFIVEVKDIREDAERKITKTLKAFSNQAVKIMGAVPGMGDTLNFTRSRLELYQYQIKRLIVLEKLEPGVYRFGYAYEDLKILNLKLKALGHAITVPEPDMINDTKVIAAMQKITEFLGFSPGSVTFIKG